MPQRNLGGSKGIRYLLKAWCRSTVCLSLRLDIDGFHKVSGVFCHRTVCF